MPEPRFQGILTIDGPSGAGKTTLGHWLSDRLEASFLETGYVYRAATYLAIESGQPAGDRIEALTVTPRTPGPTGRPQRLSLDGDELGRDLLFSEQVDRLVAQLSSAKPVRRAVTALCRGVVKNDEPMIVSGRDAGRTILPSAQRKLFLTADDAIRSRRRDGDRPAPTRDTETRQQHEQRLLPSHLRAADDAHTIDTSNLSIGEVRIAALEYLGNLR